MNKADPRGIQSIDVGGRLLTALIDAGGSMMLRDLAAATDLNPAQAHAYMTSFRRADVVEQDRASGRYQLGPLAMRLGLARIASYRPLAAAREAVIALERQLELMVAFVVWGPHAPTVVHVQTGRHPLNVNLRPGVVLSVVGSATGRVFAAFNPSPEVQRRIDAELSANFLGQKPLNLDRAGFERELETIRKNGYGARARRADPEHPWPRGTDPPSRQWRPGGRDRRRPVGASGPSPGQSRDKARAGNDPPAVTGAAQ